MPKNASFSAWLVDLDGTLYNSKALTLLMAVELGTLGWGAIATLRAFRAQHETLRRHPESCDPDPFAEQLRQTAAQRGQPEEQVRAVVQEWMFERPGKWLSLCRRRALLAEIAEHKAGGGRTALVSDYPAHDKLGSMGALSLFDAVIAAGEPGGPKHLKPHPEGYLLAAAALRVPTDQCLVLGDRDDADGAAARSAGMAFRLIE